MTGAGCEALRATLAERFPAADGHVRGAADQVAASLHDD
jgi:hypothetical protein